MHLSKEVKQQKPSFDANGAKIISIKVKIKALKLHTTTKKKTKKKILATKPLEKMF